MRSKTASTSFLFGETFYPIFHLAFWPRHLSKIRTASTYGFCHVKMLHPGQFIPFFSVKVSRNSDIRHLYVCMNLAWDIYYIFEEMSAVTPTLSVQISIPFMSRISLSDQVARSRTLPETAFSFALGAIIDATGATGANKLSLRSGLSAAFRREPAFLTSRGFFLDENDNQYRRLLRRTCDYSLGLCWVIFCLALFLRESYYLCGIHCTINVSFDRSANE